MDTTLRHINAIERYQKGESLIALAASADASVKTVRNYLMRNGVKIRSRVEQVAATMEKHGTRFYKTETRLYVSKRDAYGLVTELKVYRNNNRKPIILFSTADTA